MPVRCQKRPVQRDVTNVSARNAESREALEIELLRRHRRGKHLPPDLGALTRIGKWKLDDEPQPPQERRIERAMRAAIRALPPGVRARIRSEEHTSELQSQSNLVCRLLLEKKKKIIVKQHALQIETC